MCRIHSSDERQRSGVDETDVSLTERTWIYKYYNNIKILQRLRPDDENVEDGHGVYIDR